MLFDDDAIVAATQLNIVLVSDNLLPHVSFPVHRLIIHLKRLVNAGYTVGVFNQVPSLGALFNRTLHRIYSKATFIDPDDPETTECTSPALHLLCLSELKCTSRKGSIQINAVFIDLSTAKCVYEVFDDDVFRNALETRLWIFRPVEILLAGSVSSSTKNRLEYYQKRYAFIFPLSIMLMTLILYDLLGHWRIHPSFNLLCRNQVPKQHTRRIPTSSQRFSPMQTAILQHYSV